MKVNIDTVKEMLRDKYDETDKVYFFARQLFAEACEAIEYLESDNEKLIEELKRCTSGNGTYIAIESHFREIAKIEAERDEARRDSAVSERNHMDADFELSAVREQLRKAIDDLRRDCTTCEHKGHSGLSEPCLNCQGCGYASWKWRWETEN